MLQVLPGKALLDSGRILYVSNHCEVQLDFLQVVQLDIRPLDRVMAAVKKENQLELK